MAASDIYQHLSQLFCWHI